MEKIKIGEVTKFTNDSHIEMDVVFRYLAPNVLKNFSVENIQRICNFYSYAKKYTCEEVAGVKYVLYNTRISQGKIGETLDNSRPVEMLDITSLLEARYQLGQSIIDNWKLNEHDDLVDTLTGLTLGADGQWK
jgi:hypothetical protein